MEVWQEAGVRWGGEKIWKRLERGIPETWPGRSRTLFNGAAEAAPPRGFPKCQRSKPLGAKGRGRWGGVEWGEKVRIGVGFYSISR